MAGLKFPDGFLWGSATSAHQVEGNNRNNHWWAWEQEGGHILDGSVSGLACDHYAKYKEDIQLLKELGHQCYRFSLEWSRIEPARGKFDAREIEHYRDVLETLIDNQITPMVTLHHFTNPLWLQKMGGWENPEIIALFENYTIRIADELGDLIQFWNTINEPMVVALLGYLLGLHPPNKQDRAIYLKVAVNLLKSHAKSYHAIHRTIKGSRRPQVGIVKNLTAYEPFDPKSPLDITASAKYDEEFNWWFLNGISNGIVAPPFGNEEVLPYLKKTRDFIGINYYNRFLIKEGDPNPIPGPGEKNDMGWEIYPEGFYNLLIAVKKYQVPIYITENGISTTQDERRCRFLLQHLEAIHRAINQSVDVRGYLHWALMDNFEWQHGFKMRFGLVEVDYATLERKPRPSAYLFREINQANMITTQLQEKYL